MGNAGKCVRSSGKCSVGIEGGQVLQGCRRGNTNPASQRRWDPSRVLTDEQLGRQKGRERTFQPQKEKSRGAVRRGYS